MLNYMAASYAFLHLVYGPWKDPRDRVPAIRRSFAPFERLPELSSAPQARPWPAGRGAGAVLLAWWFVDLSRAGLYLRFIHANPRMADRGGRARAGSGA